MQNKGVNVWVVTGTFLTLMLIAVCQPLLAEYVDPQQRFSLEPPEGWQVQTDRSGVATFTAPDGVTSLVIFPSEVSESENLDSLPPAYEQLLREVQPGVSLKMLKGTRVEIAGRMGLQREYRIEREDGKVARAMVTFVKVGRLSLTLAAAANEVEFAKFKPVILKSLQTLRFPSADRMIAPADVIIRPSDLPIQEVPESVPPHIEDMIKGSSFIFIGTVRKLNATTVPTVPVMGNTVIVAVDEVLQAARTLGDYTGKEITVLLEKPRSLGVDQKIVFFANGWLYGKSIAVREVGSLPMEQETTRVREQIIEGVKLVARKDLQRHIATADLVIAGRVIDVRQARPTQVQRLTEHDPMWREAVIRIESVEKGSFPEETIVVLFPSSTDVMWYKAPKFSVEQEGIWVLHRDKIKELSIEGIEGYTALDPLSSYPISELDRIKSVIERVR